MANTTTAPAGTSCAGGNSTKLLKVYKASAGSGKTFKLAAEYVRLLVENPLNYQNILAVTFTNKATTEMKERILNYLYDLSHGQTDKGFLGAILKSNYSKKFLIETGWATKSDDEKKAIVKGHCADALNRMVHDYGRFHIETIDSFFQSIVREVARELKLAANVKLDLDMKPVLREAVKSLIEEIADPKQKDLLRAVSGMVQQKLEDGKTWRPSKDLREFGKNIFSENYMELGQDVRKALTLEKVGTFSKALRDKQTAIKAQIVGYATEFYKICQAHNFTEDNLVKRPSPFVFYRNLSGLKLKDLITDAHIERATNPAKWITASNKNHADVDDIAKYLMPLHAEVIDKLPGLMETLKLLNLVLKDLSALSVLSEIDRLVRNINKDANRFVLADTAQLLDRLIDKSFVPFIYERAGSNFKHIMIDEFQDTSRLQWKNFIPLLNNCLDSGEDCLIVGDVKQSIYRWRNSDWTTLNNMENDPDMGKHFDAIKTEQNWRSDERVVNFNNAFFEEAKGTVASWLDGKDPEANVGRAYAEVGQKVGKDSQKNKGFVRVTLIEQGKIMKEGNDKPKDETKADLEIRELAVLEQTLKELSGKGISQKSIAILIRAGKTQALITEYFAKRKKEMEEKGEEWGLWHDLNFLSEGAFALRSSAAVTCLIHALRVLLDPANRYYYVALAHHYQQEILHKSEKANAALMASSIDELKDKGLLPVAFTENFAVSNLAQLPLVDCCHRICNMFGLNKCEGQSAYLFTFFDQLAQYLQDHTGNVADLLNYWDTHLCDQTVPAGEVNGIQLLTIHKSKGLEYDNVIVPFCNWNFAPDKRTLLWCKTEGLEKSTKQDEQMLADLPVLPLKCQESMESSPFKKDFDEETMRSYVDNLNLMYVAFTRASHNLFISGAPNKGNNANALLAAVMPGLGMESHHDDERRLSIYESGEITVAEEEKKKGTIFTPDSQERIQFQEAVGEQTGEEPLSHLTFQQSTEARRFMEDPDGTGKDTVNSAIFLGNVFHDVLAQMNTAADRDRAIRKAEALGLFAQASDKETVEQMVDAAMANEQAAAWFQPHWRVLNERAIRYPSENGAGFETCRPDRVITDGKQTIVIDYKTGKQNAHHHKQVAAYMQMLRDMNYPQVSGFLWYVKENQIVAVEP